MVLFIRTDTDRNLWPLGRGGRQFDEKGVCEGGQKLVKVGDDILKAALKKANAGTRMEFDDNGTCTFKQKSGAVLRQENCVDSATPYPDYRKFLEKAKGFGQHTVFPTCLPMVLFIRINTDRNPRLQGGRMSNA